MAAHQTIPALDKAVGVMNFIANRGLPVSVKEIALSLGIPQATCYRTVRTLLKHNWIHEDEGGLRMAFGIARLARSYSNIEYALHQTEPLLHQLAKELGLSAKITLREGYHATTVFRVEPTSPNAITSPVGFRFHIAIGSAASVLLSPLSDTEIDNALKTAPGEVWARQCREDVWQRIQECRKTGASKDFGHNHPSIFAISMPLRLTQNTLAAVTVVGWPEDFSSKRIPVIRRALKHSVADMHTVLETTLLNHAATSLPR